MRSVVICCPHPVLYGYKIEENEMGGACSAYGEWGGVYWVLVGKPERKKPLGRPSRKWDDTIKMGLQEVRCEGIYWIELVYDMYRWWALVNAAKNFRIP